VEDAWNAMPGKPSTRTLGAGAKRIGSGTPPRVEEEAPVVPRTSSPRRGGSAPVESARGSTCCRCPWARPSPPDKTGATPGSSPSSCLWPRSLYCIVSVLISSSCAPRLLRWCQRCSFIRCLVTGRRPWGYEPHLWRRRANKIQICWWDRSSSVNFCLHKWIGLMISDMDAWEILI